MPAPISTGAIHSSADYTDYAEAYDNLYGDCSAASPAISISRTMAATRSIRRSTSSAADHFRKMSHELRIASPADEPAALRRRPVLPAPDPPDPPGLQVTGLGADVSVNGFPGTLWLTQQQRVDRDYAAFGELSFDIVPTVTLTGGIRAYRYDNSLIGFFGFGRNPGGGFTDRRSTAPAARAPASSGCYTTTGQTLRDNPGGTLLPPVVAGSPCTNLAVFDNGEVRPKSQDGDGITYRVNLNWHITDRHMVYATWSSGFRPGGINRRAHDRAL